MSRDDLVAFFVNVYNMLVIHGTCARGSPKNTAERLSARPPPSIPAHRRRRLAMFEFLENDQYLWPAIEQG